MMRTALIPIRDFSGMTRLSGVLSLPQRAALSRDLAELTIGTSHAAGLAPVVVTSDSDVATTARASGAHIVSDAGTGLNGTVTSAVHDLDAPWVVVHADLPLLDSEVLAVVARIADERGHAICPSIDGGTNVIAGTGRFSFSYGPGSFTRHLALVPAAGIVADRRTALEVDTPGHLAALRRLHLVSSLLS
jgi:2-phospho-L-lactate guanylyltransferase